MQDFLIRLLITIGVIWLTQLLLDTFGLQEPARKVIFVIVVILTVLWLVTGALFIR